MSVVLFVLVWLVVTGPPNGPVLFCLLSSSSVTLPVGGRARRVGGRPPPGQALRRLGS